MKIGVKRFRELVGSHSDIYQKVYVVEKNYCSYLEMRGLCKDCTSCAFHLRKAMDKIEKVKQVEEVRNERALLVHFLKGARADVVEKEAKEEEYSETSLDQLLLQIG